jgi:hypothetical protein
MDHDHIEDRDGGIERRESVDGEDRHRENRRTPGPGPVGRGDVRLCAWRSLKNAGFAQVG